MHASEPGIICSSAGTIHPLSDMQTVYIMRFSLMPLPYLYVQCPCGMFYDLPPDMLVAEAEELGFPELTLGDYAPPWMVIDYEEATGLTVVVDPTWPPATQDARCIDAFAAELKTGVTLDQLLLEGQLAPSSEDSVAAFAAELSLMGTRGINHELFRC
jgi:hypothetical protein